MTQVKEKAVQMLKSLPDEKVIYLVKIMEGLEGLGGDSDADRKREALASIQNLRGRVPDDIDWRKELAESREERYENLD